MPADAIRSIACLAPPAIDQSVGRRLAALVVGVLLGAASGSAGAEDGPIPTRPEDLTPAHLDRAVEVLVEGLIEAKDPRRHWEPARRPADESQQAQGWTAIVLLALLEAGVSPQDERIADAVESLAKASPDGTYAIATRAMVWSALPDRYHPLLERDARWLLEAFSPASGGWDYRKQPESRRRDNSITQFGSIALWLAAARGIEVPDRLWQLLEQRMLSMQLADGGWTYEDRGAPRGSMTAAGVATLLMLDRAGSERRTRRDDPVVTAVEKGLAWLDRHFDPARNPGHPDHEVYWLYSLERAALAGGISRLGGRDWFREAAIVLLDRLVERGKEGDWRMRRRTDRDAEIRLHEHALGLLCLIRGRVPVAVGLLADPADGPLVGGREMRRLVAWMGETSERELNWLRVPADSELEAWLEPALLWWAPESLGGAWSGEEFRLRLRAFLDRGGLLVADFGALPPPERESIRELLAACWRGAAWREVGTEHPARSALFRLEPRTPRLEVLDGGSRDLVIACFDGSLARGLRAEDRAGLDARRLLLNLWVLAVETDSPWPRLRSWSIPSAGATAAPVEILDLRGGADEPPEPRVFSIAAERLASRLDRAVEVSEAPIESLAERSRPCLAVARGSAAPVWTEPQWQAILGFLRRGGTLLVESPGGRGDFAAAVERELASRLGRSAFPLVAESSDAVASPLAPVDRPVDLRIDLVVPRQVTYRPSTARRTGAATSACRLRGLRVATEGGGERLAVIVSTLDLSQSLLDRPREGLDGYASETSLDLMTRILRHAQPTGVPASEP